MQLQDRHGESLSESLSDPTARNVRVRNSMLLPGRPVSPRDQAASHQHQNGMADDSGVAMRRRMTLDDGSNRDAQINIHRSQALPALSAPSSSDVSNHSTPPSPSPGVLVECDTDKPPPGCAPDAIKLFVGSIPKSCTESQLLPFFETIGKVVDLVIVRDKATRESKGSAFLWYASRQHAEVAILHFNLRHVLPDPTGEHHRPLVLRRAKPRAQPCAPAPASGNSQPSSQPTSGQLTSQPPSRPSSGQSTGYAQAQMSMQQMSMNNQPPRSNGTQQGMGYPGQGSESLPARMAAAGMAVPRSLLMTELLTQARNQGPGQHRSPPSWGSLTHGQSAYADAPSSVDDVGSLMMALRNTQLADMRAAPVPAMASQSELMSLGSGLEPTPGSGSGSGMQLVSATLDLNSQQMTLVNQYMHSLQNISGAQLSVSVGPTTFRLRVSGLQPQVETAKTLLATIMYHTE